MTNNAKLKNCLKLSSKITLYIPATVGVDQEADNSEQVKRAAALLASFFGGSTSTPAVGYWLSPAAGLVAEKTTVVFAYASDTALQDHVEEVINFCEDLKVEMGQEAVAIAAVYFSFIYTCLDKLNQKRNSRYNFSDLTGQKFGLLTVLCKDQASTTKKVCWICQCECGSIVSVLGESLRSHRTQSCGCSARKLTYDLTGQQFGYLEVVEPTKNSRIKSNETRWKCLCHNCGRIVEVSSYWLRHSNPYGHCKCTRFEDRPE